MWRFEYAIANLMSLLANINRDTKRKSKPYEPMDFMPKWDKDQQGDPKQQSVEEQKRIMFEVIKNIKRK